MRTHSKIFIVIILTLGLTYIIIQKNQRIIKIENASKSTAIELESPIEESKPLIFVGDIMLGRNIEVLMSQNGDDYPFLKVAETFNQAWGVFVNLEGPIVTRHAKTPEGSLVFSFKPAVADLLKKYNIQLVTLANNHGYDQGATGAEETRQYLNKVGIKNIGDSAKIRTNDIAYYDFNGQALAIVGFNATWPSFDSKAAVKLVQQAALNNNFVIVEIHWGDEYKTIANTQQRQWAHQLIDAGADLIVGHHPHVVEDYEVYHGRPIFYSLGNFIFDQYFSKETQEGLALAMTKEDQNWAIKLLPYNIKRGQPDFMSETERREWLAKYYQKSNIALPLTDAGYIEFTVQE